MAVKASLVGYTGFVGSNLAACCPFDGLYHTKNIREAYEQGMLSESDIRSSAGRVIELVRKLA